MIDYRLCRRYSKALMSLVLASGDLDRIDSDFSKVRQMIDQYPEISLLMLNPTIAPMEKEDLIDKFFGADADKMLLDFMKVLLAKQHFDEIKNIQENFHKLYEKHHRIQRVELVSACPVPEETQNKLVAVLKKKLNSDIRLFTEVQPKILGGLVLRFDGKEIDMSFKSRLLKLKQLLTV